MVREVFISYRSDDRVEADRICNALESKNISCWIAPRDIPPGAAWATAIVEGLQSAKAFVIVLSSHSKDAKQIARETELADKLGLTILTFRIENVDPPLALVYFLGSLQWLDGFNGQFDFALARLVDVIGGTERNVTQPPSSVAVSAGKIPSKEQEITGSEADAKPTQREGPEQKARAVEFWKRGWSLYNANYGEALSVLKQGADCGDFDCCETLAYMYDNGLGVENNHQKALEWYETAGRLGDKKAMTEIIYRYQKGFFNISPDASKARYWKNKLEEAQRPSAAQPSQ